MSEKKNMVIKVKYPTTGKFTETSGSAPNVITEWNVKRIGMTVAGLLLTALLVHKLTDTDNTEEIQKDIEQPSVAVQNQQLKPEANNKVATDVHVQPQEANKSATDYSKAIVRAQLSNGINKNEPIGKVALPLKIGRKETIGIYYFAELKGMKGKTIYHEWLLNDNLVSRKKVNISADPWRTSSKQIISYTMNNDWKVRLIDEAGNHLSETVFNLELK